MSDLPRQSPFLQQVWLRKNNWWRYLLVLLGVGVASLMLTWYVHYGLPTDFNNVNLQDGVNSLISLGLFLVLFYFIHEAPLSSLVLMDGKLRKKRIWFGLGVGMIAMGIQLLLEVILYRPAFVGFSLNIDVLAGGFFAVGLFVFASVSGLIQGSLYLFPGIFSGLKRPLWAILAFFGIILVPHLISILTIHEAMDRPLFSNSVYWEGFADSLFEQESVVFFIIWFIMDDGIELVLGWIMAQGIAQFWLVGKNANGIIELDFSTDVAQHMSSEVGLDYYTLAIALIITTIIFARRYRWQHWRSRLLSRYQKPVEAAPWQDMIDSIGK